MQSTQGDLVSLDEVLGIPCKTLLSGTELLLVSYLQYYLVQETGKMLTLGTTTVDARLLKSVYFYKLMLSSVDMPLYNDLDYKECTDAEIFEGDTYGVVMAEKTSSRWVYNISTNATINHSIMNKDTKSTAYVNLLANMIVNNYKNKNHAVLYINNTGYSPQPFEFVDLTILQEYGNKWVDSSMLCIQSRREDNFSFETFVSFYRQLGVMRYEGYSLKQKYNFAARNFIVGDVVFLYTRNKAGSRKNPKDIRELIGCYPAVIRNISGHKISIEYYPYFDNKLTRKKEMEQAEQTNRVVQNAGEYRKFYSRKADYLWSDLGIDVLTGGEINFIFRVLPSDGLYLWMFDGNEDVRVWHDSINAIYSVFKDRGVEFDEKRYFSRYMGVNTVPIYKQYIIKQEKAEKAKMEGGA